MQLIFLKSSLKDLDWFNLYYSENFTEGKENAKLNLIQALEIIKQFPEISQLIHGDGSMRKHKIQKTPFTLYYKINLIKIRLEIIHVRDERQKLTREFLEKIKQ
jgi:hypothetical protein